MNEVLKYLGVIIVLLGVVTFALYYYVFPNSNTCCVDNRFLYSRTYQQIHEIKNNAFTDKNRSLHFGFYFLCIKRGSSDPHLHLLIFHSSSYESPWRV